MLYIIGTGLNDCKDISLRSLEILKDVDLIYQECYTCIQNADFKEIESLIEKKIILADRKMVEESNEIVENAKTKSVVFLVAGTPFFATTHTDLYWRALERNIPVKIVHNTSIMNVKGCYGLYSYSFGRTISIPYFDEKCKPVSFYSNICENYKNGLHTLCLLDIKADEGRFMSVNEAIEQIFYAEKVTNFGLVKEDYKIFAICRFATNEEVVRYDTPSNLIKYDFGGPLHSLIIPAKLSMVEEEYVNNFFKNQHQ